MAKNLILAISFGFKLKSSLNGLHKSNCRRQISTKAKKKLGVHRPMRMEFHSSPYSVNSFLRDNIFFSIFTAV